MLSYWLYLFKRVRHKQDALIFLISIHVIYNFLLNTNQNIKNNSQYQYEPIFWKLNSILNDSILSIYVLLLIYTYMYYNYRLKPTKFSVVILIYFFVHNLKLQFIFVNLLKVTPYNTTLFNGLLLVHPVCLYLSYAYIIYIFTITKVGKNQLTDYFTIFRVKNKNFLTFSLIALLLGCWWAQQEVSWGGWWNWDPIEMIALLALIISLVTNHTQYKHQSLVFFFRPTLYIFVVTTYFVSRYDILNSIHSFALASKSQHYVEVKLIFLYSVVYFNVKYFFKKHPVFTTIDLNLAICLVFYFYCAYIISSILHDVFMNALSSLNVTPGGDKHLYLCIFLLLCVNAFSKKTLNQSFWYLIALSLLLLYVQSPIGMLFTILFIIIYKNNLLDISQSTPIKYKIGFLHTLLLALLYFLILYSDVEIFFTKVSIGEYFSKNFAITTTQYSVLKQSYWQDLYLTGTSSEVFFQKASDLTKLLAQAIKANCNYNANRISLTKIVCFIQNYLYLYIIIIVTAIIIWSKKSYKSGIV